MDDGIIASRYAKALLKYVLETGNGEKVCAQVQTLDQALYHVPYIRLILDNPEDVSDGQKMALIQAALGEEPLAEELRRFLLLVLEKGRIPLLRWIFQDFVTLFHRAQNLLYARLTTAVPPQEALLERLRTLVREKTGKDVVIETYTDPALIGGFVFDIEDYRMDASVARSLRDIRREFPLGDRAYVLDHISYEVRVRYDDLLRFFFTEIAELLEHLLSCTEIQTALLIYIIVILTGLQDQNKICHKVHI